MKPSIEEKPLLGFEAMSAPDWMRQRRPLFAESNRVIATGSLAAEKRAAVK